MDRQPTDCVTHNDSVASLNTVVVLPDGPGRFCDARGVGFRAFTASGRSNHSGSGQCAFCSGTDGA
jgi:hypothetical protein